MNGRSDLIAYIRGELVGPARHLKDATIIEFEDRIFTDPEPLRRGALGWRPVTNGSIEEVLYFDRETPHRKYGAGLLHPAGSEIAVLSSDQLAAQATDHLGFEPTEGIVDEVDSSGPDETDAGDQESGGPIDDDFDVTSPDVRQPSAIGISFCVTLNERGKVIVKLPRSRQFSWQSENSPAFPLNGRYELSTHRVSSSAQPLSLPIWRRCPAVSNDTEIIINRDDLQPNNIITRSVLMPDASPIELRVDVFRRAVKDRPDTWLLTAVLRNCTKVRPNQEAHEAVLYQTYFEVSVENGCFQKYPESQRPFNQLDEDEQSLALLYRESATWGIGHGCAAGWDAGPGETPVVLYADVMPAVQTPSMTPDIKDGDGNLIRVSMRSLASLPSTEQGPAWHSLRSLANEYGLWIGRKREEAEGLPDHLKPVAEQHIDACHNCLNRIKAGITLLLGDAKVRTAFMLANLSMLLQQIATKQLARRPLQWNPVERRVSPSGNFISPWDIYEDSQESNDLGWWRAFQIAFLLMSIEGVSNGMSQDRRIVDLIWFPSGGGKTEAYLGVMAFYMFHQRLLMKDGGVLRRDGTNVLMRYTLRMLTTQQFQRAASLICSMEFLRRNPNMHPLGELPGNRFGLGLWIGSSSSPNTIRQAKIEIREFRSGDIPGNPLVLTECPWCRAEIGRFEGKRPASVAKSQWNTKRTKGISDVGDEGPLLHCPDNSCSFGPANHQHWLPVEVIDERIYKCTPSIIIATADKFAMISYRPDAGAIFGRAVLHGEVAQVFVPPGLIVQDELHLISGPLGTMYGLYEGIFERLCSEEFAGGLVRPKLIASTATIRGASDQIKALYARDTTQLFPTPGLLMGDSFFGTYARHENNTLQPGRLYLGVHAGGYGSVLTTQVRTFSSALFRPFSLTEEHRDPWWSLLVFYNSIRELAGAKTLFDSDIRSRLKFLFNRESFPPDNRRKLKIVEELTSRLSQPEIVAMMDRLSMPYSAAGTTIDACLASNIIEVGVDIDRLSLMGVVGQPKTTAQYIQVTGRVGRRWWERPGLILTVYNPSKSRDRSHFEQFHSYHRRLYERVEPTSATPFALSAIQRALPGALVAWARQHSNAPVQDRHAYHEHISDASEFLRDRCQIVQVPEDMQRSLDELARVRNELENKWGMNPQLWEEFPQRITGEYLILWPGQYASPVQRHKGTVIASSMRQVDQSAELAITQGYALADE